jgi:23S rRNA (guanosine2251-2'-O)-methyltransferase
MTQGQDRLVYGTHAVASLLSTRPQSVEVLLVAAGERRHAGLLEQAQAAGIKTVQETRKSLDALLPGANHQGIAVRVSDSGCNLPEQALAGWLSALPEPAFLLVLDGVQDPRNLGACLRTADAAGVHAVIIPKDRASGVTAVVHKVASGAVQSMPLFTVTNLARALRTLKEAGVWLYGASDAAATAHFDGDLRGPLALVLGAEGQGLRRLTRELCDYQVAIPMAGTVSSLNVSVAAGVLLYEAVRQRRQGAPCAPPSATLP